MILRLILLFLLHASVLSSFAQSQEDWQEMPGWKAYFDAHHLRGSFLLYNEKEDQWLVYNKERALTSYLPASTFKIINSLLAFEYGVVDSPETLLPWNGIKHWNANWNKDLSVSEAFAVSCVPCFQEIARQIGLRRMQEGVKKAGWGQMDIHQENLDRFWLIGNSRISQLEQILFLRRLHQGTLPFSTESIQKLKTIMLRPASEPHRLWAKTGLAEQDGLDIGWYVGILQTADNTYYFALNLEKESSSRNDQIFGARLSITEQILRALRLL